MKKDILAVAGVLGMTHVICLSATEKNTYLKIVYDTLFQSSAYFILSISVDTHLGTSA